MTKDDIARRAKLRLKEQGIEITIPHISAVIDAALTEAMAAAVDGQHIELRNHFVIEQIDIKARNVRPPGGALIQIPAKRRLRITPAKHWRERMERLYTESA